MASVTDVCNLALSYLGANTITSITDNVTGARILNTEFGPTRDAELRGPARWRFAIKRAALAASTTVPPSGVYNTSFPLPTDCLRILEVGDFYPGADMADYRTGQSNADYSLEGRSILTNFASPLTFRYISQITDTTQWDAAFVQVMGAKLAWTCCERITQSSDKRKFAIEQYKDFLSAAVRSNALEMVPEFPADSSWVLARMQ